MPPRSSKRKKLNDCLISKSLAKIECKIDQANPAVPTARFQHIDKIASYQAWIPTKTDFFVSHEDVEPFVPYFGDSRQSRRKAQRVYREMRRDCSRSIIGDDDDVSDGELRPCGTKFKRSKDDFFDYMCHRRRRQIERFTILKITQRLGTDPQIWRSLSYVLGKGHDLRRVKTIHRIATIREKKQREISNRRQIIRRKDLDIRRAILNPLSDNDDLDDNFYDNCSVLHLVKEQRNGINANPNNDDDSSEHRANDIAIGALRHFCFFCHSFACEFHADLNVEPVVPIPDKKRDARLASLRNQSAQRCGPECFLDSPINLVDDDDDFEAAMQQDSVSRSHNSSSYSWRSSEETLFRHAQSIFGNDWCSIAATIGSKSCQQVHQYHQRQLMLTLSVVNGRISDKSIVKKMNSVYINENGSYNGNSVHINSESHTGGNLVISLDDDDHQASGRPKGKRGRKVKKQGRGAQAEPKDFHDDLDTSEERFIPCSHEGPCTKANERFCRCIRKGIRCEPSCGCNTGRYGFISNGVGWVGKRHSDGRPVLCRNRHPGCSCGKQGTCNSNTCECYRAQRACNPDLCESCDCVHLPNEFLRVGQRKCRNIDLVSAQHKRIFVGESWVHGFGLFTGQLFRKGDLLGPYCGRVMNSDLLDRLLRKPQAEKSTFAFDLTGDLTVDAGLVGSKVKFINHADEKEKINCMARVERVRGESRICIKAIQNIKPGQEFLMDYKIVHEEGNSWLKGNDDEDDELEDGVYSTSESE